MGAALEADFRKTMTATNEQEISLSIRELWKSYGDLVAVKNLSFDIYQGEIFGFLGPNGAGKTTVIKMICGLLKSDAGEIKIAGAKVDGNLRPFLHKLGLCPQELVIWEDLTCLEQLLFIGQQYDLPTADARRKALELLDLLGLNDRQNSQARTLSGGMKRRLNLALALVHDPEILILDEMQAGLDPQSRILVRDYVRSLAGERTILITTHDMEEADRLADRLAIIDHGELLVLNTPAALKNETGDDDILELRVPSDQQEKVAVLQERLASNLGKISYEGGLLRLSGKRLTDTLPTFIGRLHDNGIDAAGITVRKKTLEDVFIGLTGRGLRE